jgi:hypothetical protein
MKRAFCCLAAWLIVAIQTASLAMASEVKPVVTGLTVFTEGQMEMGRGYEKQGAIRRCFVTGISGKVKNPGPKPIKNLIVEVSYKQIPVLPDCPKKDIDSAQGIPKTAISLLAPGEEKEFKIDGRFFAGEGKMSEIRDSSPCGIIKVEVTSFQTVE